MNEKKVEEDNIEIIIQKSLAYCNINFLVGAGIHADSFGLYSDMTKTSKKINEIEKKEKKFKTYLDNNNIALKIENIENIMNASGDYLEFQNIKNDLLTSFKNDLNEMNTKVNQKEIYENSVEAKLISEIIELIYKRENAIFCHNFNYFTLNYDNIIDKIANDITVENNIFTPNNIGKKAFLLDNRIINEFRMQYEVRTNIFKLHGDIESLDRAILPTFDKNNEILKTGFFELLLVAKQKMSIKNSVVFVMGYSGSDHHINSILKDVSSLNKIIYFCFDCKKEENNVECDCEKFKMETQNTLSTINIYNCNKESPIEILSKKVNKLLGKLEKKE